MSYPQVFNNRRTSYPQKIVDKTRGLGVRLFAAGGRGVNIYSVCRVAAVLDGRGWAGSRWGVVGWGTTAKANPLRNEFAVAFEGGGWVLDFGAAMDGGVPAPSCFANVRSASRSGHIRTIIRWNPC